MVTLKQIHYFLGLALELHFAKAAQKLGVTQATLSCEIKKMEQKLGFSLFDRSDKWAICLTEAGKAYKNLIEKVPKTVQFAADESAKVARGECGNLTLAVVSFVYNALNIAAVCKKMNLIYPEITIRLLDHFSAETIEDYVRQGKADIGFSLAHKYRGPLTGLSAKKLIDIPVQIGMAANSPLAHKEKITMHDLKNARYIMPPQHTQPHLRHTFDKFFMANFQQLPNVVQEVEGIYGIQQFVAEGYGISLFPRNIGNEIPDRLIFKDIPMFSGTSVMLVIQEENNSPLLKNFIKLAFDEILHQPQ